jgi:hypothetical protein
MGIRKYGFAQRYAHIFDGVVRIHVEVAGASQREIESAMSGEEFEHVVEEPDTGADLVRALAVQVQRELNLGFGRLPINSSATQGCPPGR